jgi:hypothetical protein
MPEIWLKYGTTDIVLDIKFDNLASQISSNFQILPEDQVKASLDGVPLTDNMLVMALSPSKAVSKIILMLVESARAKGFNVSVDVPARMAGTLRTNLTALAGGENVPINRADYHSLQERISKFQSTVLVSAISYDPLFGFAGAPTGILRNFMPDKMAEAFSARRDNLPSPGEELEPLRIALSAIDGVSCISVELVANSSGIAGVHSGSLQDAFGKASTQFKSISVVEEEPSKCAVMSASGEPGVQTTLASSLNSLWNNIHIVKEGGTAILLAECRDGVGGGAHQMVVEGRLNPEQASQGPYIEGLEHFLFANELRQKIELGLVSTLPRYYASSRLGFTVYSGMNDVLQKLPEKIGKSYRAIVLSDADITLLKPRI